MRASDGSSLSWLRVCNVPRRTLTLAGGRSLRPVLVVNPRTDASFVEFVRERFDGTLPDDPIALQSRLRERYPEAVVRVRVLANEPSVVWYVYRDGHWTTAG
jgi:hypothetical protein